MAVLHVDLDIPKALKTAFIPAGLFSENIKLVIGIN